MNFETTLYVHNSILSKIIDALELTDYNRSSLIVLLLKHVMNDFQKLEKQKSTVKYQASDSSFKWKRVHVWFSDTEYVFCLDMRRFFRKSVSALLAYAVENYLHIVIEKLLGENNSAKTRNDNYLFSDYEFKKKVEDTAIFWIQSWKKKKKPIKQ